MTHEEIAEICHETNRAYCSVIGDNSQLPWAMAPQWQRDSAVRGIATALEGATPEQQHEAWAKDKLATGWTFGPVKNPDIKEHPCLVAYAELPPEQRVKDALFVAVVRACAAKD